VTAVQREPHGTGGEDERPEDRETADDHAPRYARTLLILDLREERFDGPWTRLQSSIPSPARVSVLDPILIARCGALSVRRPDKDGK
jgi:hypothetical protein